MATPISMATLSLVPTPSVPETRIGSLKPAAEIEEAAEAAEAGHHAGERGALRQRLDALDEGVARVDVDAGFLVG